MKSLQRFAVFAFVLLALSACAPSIPPGISISGAWVRSAPLANGNAAAYMEIRNGGPDDDSLIGVETDVAETAETHITMQHEDMAEMDMVSTILIPVNGSAVLEPGGYHIMLVNISHPLMVGDKVSLTLKFQQAGEIQIEAEVRDE